MTPRRSVILVATDGEAAVDAWLNAVVPQLQTDDELLVMAPVDRIAPRDDRRFLWLTAAEGTAVPRLRALAAERAKGELLIFSEDSVLPAPEWLMGFREPRASTGPVLWAPGLSPWNKAVFVFEYGAFLEAGSGRLAGNNFAIPRPEATLDQIHEHECARSPVLFVDQASVTHVRVYSVREAVLDRFATGFAYGARRWADRPRVLGLLAIPAIAALQLRTMLRILSRPAAVGLRSCWPALLFLVGVWSLGEGLGWFSGRRAWSRRSEMSDQSSEPDASRQSGCTTQPALVSRAT